MTFPDDGETFAIVTGYLEFRRPDRHLVMVCEPSVEPRYEQRIRRAYTATLREAEGSLIVSSIEIRPNSDDEKGYYAPDDGITPAILRAIRPEAIIAIALRTLHGEADYWEGTRAHDGKRPPEQRRYSQFVERHRELRVAVEHLDEREPRAHRGGRPPRGDDHYRELALRCLALFSAGEGAGIHMRLAEHYGRRDRTIKDWIRTARHKGWLARGKSGRVHFAPGPKLIAERERGRHGRR